MRKVALTMAVLLFAGLAAAKPKTDPHSLKLVMARQSSVDPVEIIKHLNEKCPNVTITTNPRHSDYMLYAGWGGMPYGGWGGGNYRLMVIKHGGDTIYATETVLLSNAVKNVCRFLATQPAPASAPPPSPTPR